MSLPRQVTQRTLPLPGSHTPLEPRSYKKSGYPEAALPENPGREREDARGVPTADAAWFSTEVRLRPRPASISKVKDVPCTFGPVIKLLACYEKSLSWLNRESNILQTVTLLSIRET